MRDPQPKAPQKGTVSRAESISPSTRVEQRHPNSVSWNKLGRCNNKKLTKSRAKNPRSSGVVFNSTYTFA